MKHINCEIKLENRRSILKYIFTQGRTSRQEISAALGLSMPTVLQNITELQKLGMVSDGGYFESTGGRKAEKLACVACHRYSVGLDITKNHIALVLLNFTGEIEVSRREQLKFENTDTYYGQLAERVVEFVSENSVDSGKILGIGISIPGMLSEDGNVIVDSHALGIADVPCGKIGNVMPWSCRFENDANAAGFAEIGRLSEKSTMVYLSLSNSVGGACFSDGVLQRGKNQRAGEFGHMRIHSSGRECYCGQTGCLDSYCSALRLAENGGGRLESFFEKLKNGDRECLKIWDTYLDDLALAVINLRMCYDCDVLVGGYVGAWMEPWIDELRGRVTQLNPFESNSRFLQVCRYKREASAYGAASRILDGYFSII
ncbi:MAG: ROK family transcriptional regulator [Oscillospiraceae bacterium]